MKLTAYKFITAATLGLAFAAVTAHAQLNINLNEQGIFGPAVGGSNFNVTNNGLFNTNEVITTGLPTLSPFKITYIPNSGPSAIILGVTNYNAAAFVFENTIGPTNYFTTLAAQINYDFDNDSIIDLTQAYSIALAPRALGGFNGVSYTITPIQSFGSVTINGTLYSYASAVANASGTLLDSQSTIAAIQFQFIASPVPEPSTYALFGVAALGGITWLRRRRAQQGVSA